MCQRSYKNLGDRVLSSSEEISSKLLKVDFGSVSFPLRQSLSVRVVILWLAAILLQLFLFLRTALKSFFKFYFANLTRIIWQRKYQPLCQPSVFKQETLPGLVNFLRGAPREESNPHFFLRTELFYLHPLTFLSPRRESNPHFFLRTELFYPLNYGEEKVKGGRAS